MTKGPNSALFLFFGDADSFKNGARASETRCQTPSYTSNATIASLGRGLRPIVRYLLTLPDVHLAAGAYCSAHSHTPCGRRLRFGIGLRPIVRYLLTLPDVHLAAGAYCSAHSHTPYGRRLRFGIGLRPIVRYLLTLPDVHLASPTATLRVAAGCASVSGSALYKQKWSRPAESKLSVRRDHFCLCTSQLYIISPCVS